MALVHKRKAISSISRYRFCRRYDFSSSDSRTAVPEPAIFGVSSSSSFSTQTHLTRKLLPATAVESSLLGCHRRYRTAGTYLESHGSTTCCFNLRHILSRTCTTTAYPPPAPPQEFQGGDQDAKGNQLPFHTDEPNDVAGMGGPEDLNMPPYDDANYPEDDEEYEDEELPPDPEEKLLYSPSDEN